MIKSELKFSINQYMHDIDLGNDISREIPSYFMIHADELIFDEVWFGTPMVVDEIRFGDPSVATYYESKK